MRHHNSQAPADARLSLRLILWLVFVLVLGGGPSLHAQWYTQVNQLKPGWNAVYLHVDASYTNINGLVKALDPIDEIWLWTFDLPPGLALATPPDPTPGSQWSKWTKLDGTNSALRTLPANAALLVKASAIFNWRVTGQPVAPSYRWTLSGLNFVGFPTTSTPPNFETFLAPDAQPLDWKQSAEIFRYQGGNLGTTNPIQVSPILQRSVPVTREQAFWIRAGEPTNQVYNHYFGPFQVTGSGASALRFGDSGGQARLTLKNMCQSNLTVTLRNSNSEAPPTNAAAPPVLPMMVRGPLNTTNLTFTYSNISVVVPYTWQLAPFGQPGSEVEIVLGVDRTQMGTTPGTTYASILRFQDSFGLSRVDIGAGATTASRAGLWTGNATVDNVSQYLKYYVKATNAGDFQAQLNAKNLTLGINAPNGQVAPWAISADGRTRYEWDTNSGLVLVFGTNATTGKVSTGAYLQNGPILTNFTGVSRSTSLRLIVHNDGSASRLMQRAYLGRNDQSNQVVAARQQVVAGDLANARRLSAVHLPSSDVTTPTTNPWLFAGAMQPGSSLVTTVDLAHWDHASNPFLHTYHPDHDNIDNRDNTFRTTLNAGTESYDLRRVITLDFTAPGNDFDSRTRGGTRLEGNYRETISLRATNAVLRQFNVLGPFSLTRVTATATYAP